MSIPSTTSTAAAPQAVPHTAPGAAPPHAPADAPPAQQWRARAAAALHAHRGAGLVVAGSCSPLALQEAAHRLNAVLGNAGRTVFYTDPVPAQAEPLEHTTPRRSSSSSTDSPLVPGKQNEATEGSRSVGCPVRTAPGTPARTAATR